MFSGKKEKDFGNHLVKNIVIICDLYKIAKIKLNKHIHLHVFV